MQFPTASVKHLASTCSNAAVQMYILNSFLQQLWYLLSPSPD
jgi:hypothetical protein